MTYYIFKRNKKTGKKTVLSTVDSIEEAQKMCVQDDGAEWMEFTSDIEYTKNRKRVMNDGTYSRKFRGN